MLSEHEDVWEGFLEVSLAPMHFIGVSGCDSLSKKENMLDLHQTAPSFSSNYCLLPIHQNVLSALRRVFSGRGVMFQEVLGTVHPSLAASRFTMVIYRL